MTASDADARFLDACLDSIRTQSHAQVDIVVSLWGPAVDVRPLVRRHASADVRVRLLSTAARDRTGAQATGASAARGEFVQFVKGEDQLPPRGVAALAQSLAESGADLAVGHRRSVVTLGRKVREIREPLVGVSGRNLSISDCPAVVTNLGLENRMFRTTFWLAGQEAWLGSEVTQAERVLRATMAAKTFDVVDVVAYRDMNRAVGVPVGALVDPLEDLTPWLGEQEATLAAVRAVGTDDVIDHWVASVLDGELQGFLDRVEVAGAAHWSQLRGYVRALLELAPAAADRIRAESRVKVWLLADDQQGRLADLVVARWFEQGNKATLVEDGRVYARLPGFRDPEWDVPDDTYLMSPAETALEVVLRNVRRLPDDTLEITLFTWVDFVSFAEGGRDGASVDVVMVDVTTGERVQVPAALGWTSAVNHFAEHRYQDYGDGLLTLTLPVRDLPIHGEHERTWRFEVALTLGALSRTSGITRRDERGIAGLLGTAQFPAVETGDTHVSLNPHPDAVAVLVSSPRGGTGKRGGTRPAAPGRTLQLEQITVHPGTPPRLVVQGRFLGQRPRTHELRLRGPQQTLTLGELAEAGDGRSSWEADLEADEWGRGSMPIPSGRYAFELTCGARTGSVQLSPELLSTMLDVVDTDVYSWRLFRRGIEAGLYLARPVPAEERSPYYQRRLQVGLGADRAINDHQVYLQSYVGASATDSQVAIHRELRRRFPEWTLFWGVYDRSCWVPEGAVPVVLNTSAWYDALATSRYLVNNIDFDRWFSPRPGQKFLQTFHGYPAKSMGIRLWTAKQFTPRRIDAELARTAEDWDLILTPTPEMDEHYRREYRYSGAIHSAGYPRDDDLLAADADQTRERTRKLLGIGADQTAVLYAPTWRDDLATNYRNAERVEHIDLEDASESLGPEFVFLMRGHRFHGKAGGRAVDSARLIDVTHYPEINDLILAADAAVLDYSSLRFDFALTRRPMLFLVPDLAEYTGSVRGFLYDFAPSAPGPLLDRPEQVIEALQDLPKVSRDYAAAYDAFHDRFNYLQDGRAAERVVDAFFDPD